MSEDYVDRLSDEQFALMHGELAKEAVKDMYGVVNRKGIICLRCGTDCDPFDQMHFTCYEKGKSLGVLCNDCFDATTPDERWPFYRCRLAERQRLTTNDCESENLKIKAAVASGF